MPTFDRHSYIDQYDHLRSMPSASMSVYLGTILSAAPTVQRVLDVGAGTGQFALPIAQACPNAIVEALDPSARMIEKLNDKLHRCKQDNVRLRHCMLSDIPSTSKYDLLLLSEVVHIFDDPIQLVNKLASLTDSHGCIAIRTSSQEQLRRQQWYRHFPTARLIDMHRHHPIELLSEGLRQRGLVVSEVLVDESRTISSACFLQMITAKMFSTLDLLGEGEFSEGCRFLHKELLNTATYFYDYEMTLLVARSLE